MMKIRPVYITSIVDGEVEFATEMSEASIDPIRARRIMLKAQAGDEKAKRRWERMQKNTAVTIRED